MEVDALVLLDDGANLFDGLNGANLVVDHHDTDETCFRPDRLLELGEVDETGARLDRQVGDVKAFVLKDTARVEDTFVLGLSGNTCEGTPLSELKWPICQMGDAYM